MILIYNIIHNIITSILQVYGKVAFVYTYLMIGHISSIPSTPDCKLSLVRFALVPYVLPFVPFICLQMNHSCRMIYFVYSCSYRNPLLFVLMPIVDIFCGVQIDMIREVMFGSKSSAGMHYMF